MSLLLGDERIRSKSHPDIRVVCCDQIHVLGYVVQHFIRIVDGPYVYRHSQVIGLVNPFLSKFGT